MTEKTIDNKVQLGCGTLIIIAIIVMVFSGGSESKKMRSQVEDVNRKLDRIEKKLDEVSQKLGRLPASGAGSGINR
jgi:outer membrane murein-binding lipoprotein Lpp